MTRLKLKRYYKLPALLALLAALLAWGAGDQRVLAYSVPDTGQLAGMVITYGRELATIAEPVAEGLPLTGAIQAISLGGTK